MSYFEKPGLFYLGREIDPRTQKQTQDLLYDSKHLTTHAVCVGMTGSGKTGLGIVMLEEAGIDKIPALVIDPKGDLSNLLLTFPELSPSEFEPWIDHSEAESKGVTPKAYSESIASTWKEGLAAWGEDEERIKKFRNSVDLAIYTPASKAGIPISILNSFSAPPQEEMQDEEALREKILSITSSLLGLLGINADPVKSREHILISNIIQKAWQNGKNLDIASLIQQVQNPPFTKVGALDIDTFYPQKDRLALSINLNNLLASPGFQVWMEGVPLDIGKMLYTKEGKPKLSVISIAHLSDKERMFFVTLFLNEFISWMRQQSGTSSLRTILYMDEIFGFFPPIASPPSKLPMLLLLKQARAYGIGIILATQNPVDLDYKGLSNCGTWFIGKLQTERDKTRVLEGLKIASNGEMDSKELDQMIALTGKRKFIMRSIYEKSPILFETRWTLSYLKGPLTLNQIGQLETGKEELQGQVVNLPNESKGSLATTKPTLPSDVQEYFANTHHALQPVHYAPKLLGIAKIHFVNTKNQIDVWEDVNLVVTVDDEKEVNWEEGEDVPDLKRWLQKEPLPNSVFAELPPLLAQEKKYSTFAKQLATTLYQNQTYTLYQTAQPPMISKQGESESDFRIRAAFALREKRDEYIKKIHEKYAPKISTLTEKINRAQNKVSQKKQFVIWQKIQNWLSFIFTIFMATLNRKVTRGTISQTETSLRRATKVTKDSQDTVLAEGDITSYQKQLEDLQSQMNQEIAALTSENMEENLEVESISIRPRKNDIDVQKVGLVWWA